jgi:hypothetical protein
MYGNNVGKSGKNVSEDEMSSAALIEAKSWADDLMSREFQGRGDKEYLARYRLSERTGVSESYLYRLQYKTRDMKDVAGSVYRALKLAYDEACRRNEEAAARHRAERLSMDVEHEAADGKRDAASVGVVAAALETTEEAET